MKNVAATIVCLTSCVALHASAGEAGAIGVRCEVAGEVLDGYGVGVGVGREPPVDGEQAEAGVDGRNAPDAAFEARLREVDAQFDEVKTLRGRFVQKKHTPLLRKPLESSGTVAISGERTRWDTAEPRRSVMTIDGRGLRIYFPEQRVVEIYDLGEDVREFSGSPLPRLAKLRESFDLSALGVSEMGGEEGDGSLLAIELLPRTDSLREHIAYVRVLIDSGLPAVRRVEIEDVDGELTEIEFLDVEINALIEEREVELDVPRGTREVHPLDPRADDDGQRGNGRGRDGGRDGGRGRGT